MPMGTVVLYGRNGDAHSGTTVSSAIVSGNVQITQGEMRAKRLARVMLSGGQGNIIDYFRQVHQNAKRPRTSS